MNRQSGSRRVSNFPRRARSGIGRTIVTSCRKQKAAAMELPVGEAEASRGGRAPVEGRDGMGASLRKLFALRDIRVSRLRSRASSPTTTTSAYHESLCARTRNELRAREARERSGRQTSPRSIRSQRDGRQKQQEARASLKSTNVSRYTFMTRRSPEDLHAVPKIISITVG